MDRAQLIRNTSTELDERLDLGRAFLDLASAEHIPPLDSILHPGEGFIGGPDPIAALATYEAAIGSGQIALIQNQRFLEAMAEYRSLEDLNARSTAAWAESYYLGAHLELRRRLGSLGVISRDLDDCGPNTALCPYPQAFIPDSQEIIDLLREPEVYAYLESIRQILNSQYFNLLRLDEAVDQALSALDG